MEPRTVPRWWFSTAPRGQAHGCSGSASSSRKKRSVGWRCSSSPASIPASRPRWTTGAAAAILYATPIVSRPRAPTAVSARPPGRTGLTCPRHRSKDPAADAVFDRTMAAVRRRGSAARGTGGRQPAATGTVIRHPLAWCAWGIAGLGAAFIDRNPLLQVLLVLVVINVGLPHRGNPAMRHWKIGLALAVVPILFSAALSRFGHHVIFILPGIPIIGGAWSWEAVAYGASAGMALLLTVAVFAWLQASVRSADLVALLPRPLYRAGTVFALSLAFAPKTVASFQALREARRLRGQRAGWRSAPGLDVPLLLKIGRAHV